MKMYKSFPAILILLIVFLNSMLRAQPNLRFKEHSEHYVSNTETVVSLVIENNGNTVAPACSLGGTVGDQVSHTIYGWIPSLESGETYDFEYNHDSYWWCYWHTYNFALDYENKVTELDETDNELHVECYSGTVESCGDPGFLLNQCHYDFNYPILKLSTPITQNNIFWLELYLLGPNSHGLPEFWIDRYENWYQVIPQSYNTNYEIDFSTSGLPPGNYDIYGIADTSPKSRGDIDDSNNELLFQNAVVIPDNGSNTPDIYIKSPGTFPSTCPGSSFTHDLTLGNSGGTLEQNFKVCIYASQDQNITTSDYKLGCFTVTPSHFGSRNYCNLSITCDPSNLSGGMWYFGIIVDPDNELEEDNENDNSYCSPTPTSVEGNATISVTTPNGGESWELGSTHTLHWSSNAGGNVKIHLFKQGSYYRTITSSTANDGRYTWTIPQDYDAYSYYRISVISINNNSVQDYSDGYFSLTSPQSITISSPNGGENWQLGSSHAISWSSNASGNIKVELYKEGLFYKTIASYTANDGRLNWVIPESYDEYDNYRIRITSLSNGSISDFSDNYFRLSKEQSIQLTTPNGGEDWQIGTTHNITWTSNAGGSVKIHLFKQGSFYKEITSSTNNDGSFAWTIPADYDEYSNYRIRITSKTNSNTYDYSDNYFRLSKKQSIQLTSPNGGEEWQIGTTHNITWTSNAGGNVKIHLFKQGSFYKEITSSTNNDGGFSWTIPSDYDAYSYYRIRITSTSNSNIYDYSDNYFQLVNAQQTETVWPGDTNNSGYVDQADVLPIGLYFHSTGQRRDMNGNQWRACTMSDWTTTAAGYADCDGDGTVNQADILAVGLNWHKSHSALAKAQVNVFDRTLAMQIQSGMDSRGQFIAIGVQNANELMGISFELDLNLSDGHITSIEYQDVFKSDKVQYQDIHAGRIALGVSLKDTENSLHGSAEMCRIYYDGFLSEDNVCLENILGINALGNYVGSVAQSYTLASSQIVKPNKLVLYPNYPNPFNPITTIRYDLPESGMVRLDILNVKGEVVKTLVNQQQVTGSYAVQWDATRDDGSTVASGVYLYRIQTSDQQIIRKLLYTK